MLSRIYSPSKNEDGFTLIELLIVVIIIGILAAIALPIFLNQQKAAADASVQSDVRNTIENVATWLTNSSNQGKAEANTGAFVTDGGKAVISSGNTVGVAIATDGSYTVCGYTANGNQYKTASAAYTYDSKSGNFTAAACATGSDTGGAGPNVASTVVAAPAGGVSNGVYTATLESGDSTNSMWGHSTGGTGFGISTLQAHTGTQSYAMTYTGANANADNTNATADNGNTAWISFTPSPGISTAQAYNIVSFWVYTQVPANSTDTVYLAPVNGGTSSLKGLSAVTANGTWQQVTMKIPTTSFGSATNFKIGVYNNGASAGGKLYVDDLTITPSAS